MAPLRPPPVIPSTAITPGRRCISERRRWMPGQHSMARYRSAPRRWWDAAGSAALADVEPPAPVLAAVGPGVAARPLAPARPARHPLALLRPQDLPGAGPAAVAAEEVRKRPGRHSLPCWPIGVSGRHARRQGQRSSIAPRWLT